MYFFVVERIRCIGIFSGRAGRWISLGERISYCSTICSLRSRVQYVARPQRKKRESPPLQGWGESRALSDATAGFRPLGIVLGGNSIVETNLETLGSFPPTRATRRSQYPCPCNTGWGDGTTNPTPSACEPVHRGPKDRQADGTARVRPPSNGGRSPGAVSGAVRADTASLVGTCNTPHPAKGRSTEHEPEYAHAAEACSRRTARTHAPFCRVR